jgi:hypothetical protein
MKAIVNVNKKSIQAKNNGLTFPVKEVLSTLIALDINGVTTDFSHKEVFIVDIKEEHAKAFQQAHQSSEFLFKRILSNLEEFIHINKIKL